MGRSKGRRFWGLRAFGFRGLEFRVYFFGRKAFRLWEFYLIQHHAIKLPLKVSKQVGFRS